VDAAGREFEQPAELVILCAYGLHNVRLLMLSGIGTMYDPRTGQGTLGRNYTYQIPSSVQVHFEDRIFNPFMGAGALGMIIDDFNGDNFDHSGLGFIGGAYIGTLTTGQRPIEFRALPPDTPRWGSSWKQAMAKWYNRTFLIGTWGGVMPYKDAYLDLDPTYRDIYGNPLLRMTYNWHDNELKMSRYVTGKAAEIAKAMKPTHTKVNYRTGDYSIVPYQTTHNTGGAIMGTDPQSSVVNRYLQHWDVPNLFVMGASAFPHNPANNPTTTVGALTYWAADAIKTRYLNSPRQLL
jgi:gluconate 2-dehydrogenase alpha chain